MLLFFVFSLSHTRPRREDGKKHADASTMIESNADRKTSNYIMIRLKVYCRLVFTLPHRTESLIQIFTLASLIDSATDVHKIIVTKV